MKLKRPTLPWPRRAPKGQPSAPAITPRTVVLTTLHEDACAVTRAAPSLHQTAVTAPSPLLLPPPLLAVPASPIPGLSREIAPCSQRATVALGPRVIAALQGERARAQTRQAHARRMYDRARAVGIVCSEVSMDHVVAGPFFTEGAVVLHLATEPEDKVSAEALLHLPFFVPADEMRQVVCEHMADFAAMAHDIADWCVDNGLKPPMFGLMSEARDPTLGALGRQTHWPLVGFFCCTRLQRPHEEPAPALPSTPTGSLHCMAELLEGPDNSESGPSRRPS
jgi:hypothetical protein